MMKANTKERGTTLIELLIAITMLSLLAVGMIMVFRVGLNAMQRTKAHVTANRRTAGAQRILEQQVADLMPMVAECMGNAGQSAGKEIFFQGEPQTMRFVSSYSLAEANRGYPRILEYQVIPADNPQTVRLVVNEMLYSGPRSAGVLCGSRGPDPRTDAPVLHFRPVEVGGNSFVLADNLAYCRMSYLLQSDDQKKSEWVPIWTKDNTLPRAIRIDMAPAKLDPGRLPPLPFTAPVHILKAPKYQYNDWWETKR
jgi:general secretion pathway protein J